MSSIESAREIILHHGRNATSYQLLNHGISRWISPDREALIGYVRTTGRVVVAGDPVSAPARATTYLEEFQRELGVDRSKVLLFCSESTWPQPVESRQTLIGTQPVWSIRSLLESFEEKPSLRAQLNRARNKGLECEMLERVDPGMEEELREVLREWLETRILPPLHFLVEPRTLDRKLDRRLVVARQNGTVVAWLVASPIPNRRGWLVEQIVRGDGAPNGTAESLLFHVAHSLQFDYDMITLGLIPLSRRALPGSAATPAARFLLAWVRLHGERFYHFRGLEFFKEKFEPDSWEPIYASTFGRRFNTKDLVALGSAFTAGALTRSLMIGLWRAARAEIRRASSRNSVA